MDRERGRGEADGDGDEGDGDMERMEGERGNVRKEERGK